MDKIVILMGLEVGIVLFSGFWIYLYHWWSLVLDTAPDDHYEIWIKRAEVKSKRRF